MAVDTNTVRRLCFSLLNAAGWTNVPDANITSGAATLTTTASVFASTDVGKTVYILGAGASGATLSTTITGFTSATQVTVGANASTTVASGVASFGGDVDDDRRNVAEMDETIYAIDLEVCRTILENPQHPQWGSFGTVNTISSSSNPTTVGSNPGAIRLVQRIRTDTQTVPATRVPYRTLQQWSRNVGSQFSSAYKENFYALQGGNVYFAGGGSITFKFVALSKLSTCQSPDEYAATVAAGTMALLLPKEGDDLNGAAFYRKAYEDSLTGIRQAHDQSEGI